MDPTSETDARHEAAGAELAAGWTRTDFEAALHLFVGGDLEPVEAAAVQAFLHREPECQVALEAARAARAALVSGVTTADGLDQVDLWPGIRSVLVVEGRLGVATPKIAVLGPKSVATPRPRVASAIGEVELVPSAPRRAWPRWAGSGLAAAAGLVFALGLGWGLGFDAGFGGGRNAGGVRGSGAADAIASVGGARVMAPVVVAPTGVDGGTARVHLVGTQEVPHGVIRLGAPIGPPLEDQAFDVDLGHYHPDAVFPLGGRRGASLVGGTSSPRAVLVLPPRQR